MSDFDIEAWVNQSDENKYFRQAVHVIIFAISEYRELQEIMVMKGGILLALGYRSTRFTRDIDFSTETKLEDFDVEAFVQKFDHAVVTAVDRLDYGIDCLVQGWKQQPPVKTRHFRLLKSGWGMQIEVTAEHTDRLLTKERIKL